MNTFRDQVLTVQRELKSIRLEFDYRADKIAWESSDGEPLAERYAKICAARLDLLHMEYDPEHEWILGRIREVSALPGELEEAQKWFVSSPCCSPGQTGHAELDTDLLLQSGIDGVLAASEKLPGAVTALQALSHWIVRCGQEAGGELEALCKRIAHQKPETFREALQLLYFQQLAVQIGDKAVLIVPGRLDRRLIDFYNRDLKKGILTEAQALEMVENLYFAINWNSHSGLAYSVMVGGRDVNGKDCSNALSWICLEALRRTGLVYPSVGLCWNSDTPEDLQKLAVELIALGYSNVAIFNDALIQQGLRNYGVSAEDACNYINSTCVEITPCGDSNIWVASPYISLPDLLMEELKSTQATDYQTFKEGFYHRVGQETAAAAEEQNQFRQQRKSSVRRPLQSAFTRGCRERMLDLEEGGAKYNHVECSFVGLANTVDSLVALKHEVFGGKRLKKELFLSQLEDPLYQQYLLHSFPKYGNGNSEADSEIPQLIRVLEQECAKHRMEPDGSRFIPGTFCWIMHQRLGNACGPTPDGRSGGIPFADGAGPAQGREWNGPTAAVRSVCSWNHCNLIGGSAFNMKFLKSTLADETSREKLRQLLQIFVQQGGFETQINVLDVHSLEDARMYPEKYADLVVRIGGYTDYFVKLSPAMQQEVILRTSYSTI